MVIIASLTRKKAGRPPIPLRNTGNSKIQDLLSGLISTGKVLNICCFQYLEYLITAYHDKYKMLDLLWKSKHLTPIKSLLLSEIMEVVFVVLENMQQNAVQFLPFIDLE